MKISAFWRLMALCAMVLPFAAPVMAQDWDENEACPGWHNPLNFTGWTEGDLGAGGYSGSGGVKNASSCPNVMTGATGTQSLGPNYNADQMNTITASGCYRPASTIPLQQRQFAIMDINGNASGSYGGSAKDPNTNNGMRYVPTHMNSNATQYPTVFTRSIRIGDGCSNGGNYGVSLLNYDMDVTSSNALLYLYYAIVAESPSHNHAGNPTFIIRLMKKNGNNWQQISDRYAYYISSTSTTITQSGQSCPNMVNITPVSGNAEDGNWHSAPNSVIYKDWDKVMLNLSDYLYSQIRVQVLIYDCSAEFHYAYAYIAGECRPLAIQSSGCPGGDATEVTTLTAPTGLQRYAWYASDYGYSSSEMYMYADTNLAISTRYFTFHPLTTPITINNNNVSGGMTQAQNGHIYKVQANDFKVTKRKKVFNSATERFVEHPLGEAVDSVGNWQTFRCTAVSAIDPDKPFTSSLYVTVRNLKPTMKVVDTMAFCGGDVHLQDSSFVAGDQNLIDTNITWTFYQNTDCTGDTIRSFSSRDTTVHFNGHTPMGMEVRADILEHTLPEADRPEHRACYSTKKFVVTPLPNPVARMTVSKHMLCDQAQATLTDESENTTYRRWNFLPFNAAEGDTAMTDVREGEGNVNKSFARSFSHDVEPIRLTVRNGLYYLDTTETHDTVWCEGVARDTVLVFLRPKLHVEGDTIVCQGSKTDAKVSVVGGSMDNTEFTYRWSEVYGDTSNIIAEGDVLQVEPYAGKSTYYVEVTAHPQNCRAWGSINAYLVTPSVVMEPADGRICPGDTVRLIGGDADHYTWTATPADPSMLNQDSNEFIQVTPKENTVYTMVGHGPADTASGKPGCDALPLTKEVTVLPLPVPKVSVTPPIVDVDDPTVVLRDVSDYSVGTRWIFDEDGSEARGTEVKHTFGDVSKADVVYVTLIPHNELNCEIKYPFSIPVKLFTAWMPTAFTPGSEDENSRFRLFTINDYEYFHIYIYNRRGEIVYESTDPKFEWDGSYEGQPLPQGAYVYVCRYRKPEMNTLAEIRGTVTLIR